MRILPFILDTDNLIYSQQNSTHQFTHVGCRRLGARVYIRLQTLYHSPTPLVASQLSVAAWHLLRNSMVADILHRNPVRDEITTVQLRPKHSVKNRSLGSQTHLYTSWVTVACTQNKLEPPSYAASLSVATVATDNLTLHHYCTV